MKVNYDNTLINVSSEEVKTLQSQNRCIAECRIMFETKSTENGVSIKSTTSKLNPKNIYAKGQNFNVVMDEDKML